MRTAPAEVELIIEEDWARLILNRPEARNALSERVVLELARLFDSLTGERRIRGVTLESRGPVFCSGHDLKEMIGRELKDYDRLFGECTRMMQAIRRLPLPVIARVQGPAVAAGCQLVAACDLAVAADSATFSTPGVKIGLFCTTPMVPLVRAIAPRAALEMLLTGMPISAERAYELGLVNRVTPIADLDACVDELKNAIRAVSPEAIALGKGAFYRGLALDEPAAYADATTTMIDNAQLPDAREGIAAFLEKRPPEWPSRRDRLKSS